MVPQVVGGEGGEGIAEHADLPVGLQPRGVVGRIKIIVPARPKWNIIKLIN